MNEQTIEDWIGDGYFRIDHEYYRKRKQGFWEAMQGVSLNGTIMLEWERSFGTALEFIRPFLRLNGDAVDSISCPGITGCGCAHRVYETRHGEIVLCCTCEEDSGCDEYLIQREDTLCHGVDWRAWDDAVRRALGFGPPSASPHVTRALREIGSFDGLAPVYVSFESEGALLRELIRVQGLRDGPFMVLTATGSIWGEQIEMLTRPRGVGHIALSSVLDVILETDGTQGTDGKVNARTTFKARETVAGMLADFRRRISKGSGMEKLVERIEGGLQAIARNAAELKQENMELKEMQGAGLFKFALRVDGEDFRAFATVMALGNRKAAAEFLDVPARTFYHRVEGWRSRGKDYQRMYRMVEWRKAVGRKIQVRLEDSVMSSDADGAENPETLASVLDRVKSGSLGSEVYPSIAQQVLSALRAQNEKNWQSVRGELVEVLEEEVLQ